MSLPVSQDPEPWLALHPQSGPCPPGQDLGLAQFSGPTTPTPSAKWSRGKPWLLVQSPPGEGTKGATWGPNLPASKELPLPATSLLLPHYVPAKVKSWSSSLGMAGLLKRGGSSFLLSRGGGYLRYEFHFLGRKRILSVLNREAKFRVSN